MRASKNKWTRHPRAGGPHTGAAPANMSWEMFLACHDGKKFNDDTYVRLHTTIDLAGLYDILEGKDVGESWKHAAMFDSDWRRDQGQ